MLKWYLITASSSDATNNVLKSLRRQHLMVRKRNGNLYACVSNNHQQWLSNVCQDFSAQLKTLEKAPEGIRSPTKEEYLTSCGQRFYDPLQYSNHIRGCNTCKEKVKERRQGVLPAKVIAKLEPGVDFDLNGVISSLEVVRDQLWEKVEQLDNLLINLKVYRDSKEEVIKLNTEVKKRIDAVRLLLGEGKL